MISIIAAFLFPASGVFQQAHNAQRTMADTATEASSAKVVFASKSRKNFRKKPDADAQHTDGTDPAPGEDVADDDVAAKLQRAREELDFRKRPAGINAVTLALGAKLTAEEEAELSGQWSAKVGGLMPRDLIVQDRNRDRTGETSMETRVTKTLGSSFAQETQKKATDEELDKFIEAELAKKQAVVPEGDTRSQYEKMKAALYEVPDHLKKLTAPAQPKKEEVRGMLSSQVLTGIVEVDLGIDSKIKNIEETERIKREMLQAKMDRKKREGYHDPMHQPLVKNRYQKTDPAENYSKDFDLAKKKAFEAGTVDAATYTEDPVQKPQKVKRETASDSLAVDRFIKRMKR